MGRRNRITASKVLAALAVLVPLTIVGAWWLSTVQPHPHFDVTRKIFGNITTPLKGAFYIAVAGFTGLMLALFSLRLKNVQRGAAESRRGLRAQRIRRFLAGISMRTVAEDKSTAVMHSAIYYGFLVLFAGTITLELDNLAPESLKFLHGDFYLGYSAVLDAFGLVFLAGLTLAALRRYGVRPWRLRSKTKTEDAWILLTLAVVGITGLAVEAARIAVDGRPDFEAWSFVGYPLSRLVPRSAASGIHQGLWITHAVAFAAFLVAVPMTKLRHMVTSPANLLLSPKERPTGAMKPLPNLMELEDIESIGAATVAEFTWKQLFDTEACTVCGRCTSVCPASQTGKPLDPREIVLKLGEVAAADAGRLVPSTVRADGAVTVESDQVFARIRPEELWACTSCRACDEICPVDIEILDKILDMRRYLTLMEADFPSELGSAFLNMENSSNPWGMSQQSRADWTADVDFDVPILGVDTAEAEYLYWVGCAGSFDERNRKVTVSTARLLHAAGVDFAVLGTQELCTGDPARRAGNEYVFQQLALQNIATLNELGVRNVITQCPHCFNTLTNEYPQLGGTYEVVHHSQLLADLIAEGRLEPAARSGKRITYHDACYLGRHNSVFLAPRDVIQSAAAELVEMPRNGTGSFCCGAGGARMWMEERTGKKVNVERTEEALDTGANAIATACPYCFIMLDDGVKELGRDDDVQVKDIAMLLAESIDQ